MVILMGFGDYSGQSVCVIEGLIIGFQDYIIV